MPLMCSLIENTGHDPPLVTPYWDSAAGEQCCLRVAVYRFAPYVLFAGGDMFVDLSAPVYHLCGSVINALQILTAAVNCTCLRAYRAPHEYSLEGEQGIRFSHSFDVRVIADLSYTAPELVASQADHYPLGSIATGSLLGKENTTPARGIRILELLQPAVWVNFWLSLFALTLILALTSGQSPNQINRWSQTFRSFLCVMGVCLGQSFVWTSVNHPSRLVRLKNVIIGILSLLSTFILIEAATADLLELLMYQPGTDRFTSIENVIQRATEDLCVIAFYKSPLWGAIQENKSLLPNYRILMSAEEMRSSMISVMDQIVANRAVLNGVLAALTFLKATAVNALGYHDYRDVLYVQSGLDHAVPYYVKTSRLWPRDKLGQWRRTTAALLESGLSEFAYRCSLAQSVPDVLRQEAKERHERAQILTAAVIKLWSIWTILIVCLVLFAGAALILLITRDYATPE